MKLRIHLTNETAKLVEQLLANPGVLDFLRAKPNPSMETVAAIEAAGEPAALPYLALLALDAKDAIRERAAQACASLLKPLTPDDLLILDQSVRRLYVYGMPYHTKWAQIESLDVSVMSGTAVAPETVLARVSAALAHAPPATARRITFFIR